MISTSPVPDSAPSTSIPPTSSGSALAALDPYTRDPYYTYHHGASSADAYVPPPRRDELSSGSYYVDGRRETYLFEADPLRRREADQIITSYSSTTEPSLKLHLHQFHLGTPLLGHLSAIANLVCRSLPWRSKITGIECVWSKITEDSSTRHILVGMGD